MELAPRRKALADALSAHDSNAVKAFLHPSFVVRGTDHAIVMGGAELAKRLPTFFQNHPEYKQSIEIESSNIEGDSAILSTRRAEILNTLWRKHTVCSRWIETWKMVDGQWMLAEESPVVATPSPAK